MAEIFIMRIA